VTERTIRIFGDPVLKTRTERITAFDAGTEALVADLIDSVRLPGRAGVAATQIGVGLRAFSYNIDGDIGYILNPDIVETSEESEEVDEGCLSVPGLWFPTKRYTYAKVRGLNLAGDEVMLSGTGLMAQALQHECDHLDGLLFIDRLEGDRRREAMRAIRESDWF
jgi:peptide deformylase